MSRSNHPTKRNYDSHPYWRYGWWSKHGPADVRRIHNRIGRAREKQAIREGRDPPRQVKYLVWIWW